MGEAARQDADRGGDGRSRASTGKRRRGQSRRRALRPARASAIAFFSWKGVKPTSRLQERAREARYRLLVDHAKAIGADALMTAHHADDQAETVLFRLLRGSGLTGLRGMDAMTARDGMTIARPLMGLEEARSHRLRRGARDAVHRRPFQFRPALRPHPPARASRAPRRGRASTPRRSIAWRGARARPRRRSCI